jgi:hypothetical protein
MASLAKTQLGSYLKAALEVLRENNNHCSSRELIQKMEKKLTLNEWQRSLNKSGVPRWETNFRFWSIGYVKGGFIKKQKRIWYLTDKGQAIEMGREPEYYEHLSTTSYDIWKKNTPENGDDENDDNPLPITPVDLPLSNLKIKPDSLTFNDLLAGVDKQQIQIPPFQRNFVWTAGEIVSLLDSIYRGYPIGSLIFWRTSRNLPHHREIGKLDLLEESDIPIKEYVIDGQQRITSLYAAIRGAEIEGEKIHFYFDVSLGRFDSERNDPEASIHADDINITRIPLPKIFVKATDYYSYVGQFPDIYQTRLHDLYDRFNKYNFSVIYVEEEKEIHDEQGDIKQIVDIFSKINDTGRKLTITAKMIAKCWGANFNLRDRLNDFLDESDEFVDIREETILQTASVIINDKKCTNNTILYDTDIRELESQWDETIESLKLALDFLRKQLRIKNLRYLPFDSIIVPLAYFHFQNKSPNANQTDQLVKWFWKIGLSNRYGSSTPGRIEEDCKYFDRILEGESVEFNYPIDWDSLKIRLIEQDYNFRNAFCKTVLTLYSFENPKHFKDNGDIDLTKSFSDYSKYNLHHIFPRDYLMKINHPQKDLRDSIVNIAFAPMLINLEISNKPPSEYISELRIINTELDKTLKSHLIDNSSDFGITSNDYDMFLNKRAENIENHFRWLTGIKSKTEQLLDTEPQEPLNQLELGIRSILAKKLIEKYGSNFWRTGVIPQDVRDSVQGKIKEFIKLHPYNSGWYSDGTNILELLDIMDYYKIIDANWDIFESLFGSRDQGQKHFLAIKNFRNPLKHIRELDPIDKKNGEAAVLWFEKIISNH